MHHAWTVGPNEAWTVGPQRSRERRNTDAFELHQSARLVSDAKPQVRGAAHHARMSWLSFEVSRADARTARGFVLIGRLVRRRRTRVSITQRQLEHLSGVDQTVISRLENGRLGGLRWSRFARLVDALGGLGEADPEPGWTARFMPRTGGEVDQRGHR
jgi:hypothetical protein